MRSFFRSVKVFAAILVALAVVSSLVVVIRSAGGPEEDSPSSARRPRPASSPGDISRTRPGVEEPGVGEPGVGGPDIDEPSGPGSRTPEEASRWDGDPRSAKDVLRLMRKRPVPEPPDTFRGTWLEWSMKFPVERDLYVGLTKKLPDLGL